MDSGLFIPNLRSDLSRIISEHSTIFIKSYGNGTLATPSFRGTSAQHTQVEWNGINLNSPMLGQMDFSQVPVAQFDGLEILYGASGISRSSGAFGGIIDLITLPDWNNRVNALASQTLASFNTYTTNLNICLGRQNIQSHTKFNYTSAQNNFPYTDNSGVRTNQEHASFVQYGLSQELFWRWNDRHLLSAKIWYSDDDRNLPPTTSSVDTAKTEKLHDRAIRAVVEYKLVDKRYHLLFRSALNDQYMNYSNSALDLNSVHQTYSWINRIRFTWLKIKNLKIKPGIDFTYDWVRSDDYTGRRTRSVASLFTEINYSLNKHIQSSLVLREDIIDFSFTPLIAAFGVGYKPFTGQNLMLNLNVARNYRYPTLNDLYWQGAGNPDLKPESSYSIEAGITFNIESKNRIFYCESNLTGYYTWLYNMITWSPVEGNSSLFKPENVDEIKARGIEAGLNFTISYHGLTIGWRNNYHYCRSTYEKANSSYDQKIGKQQIYIPENTFNSTLSIEKWKFYLTYNFYFVSARYTGKDNLTMMPGYNLSNIIFGKNITLKNFIISLQLDCNNLFDLDYQSVASRPMPGINYALTVKLGFSGSSKN